MTFLENGNFSVKLESIDFEVELKLLSGADEARWSAQKEKRKKLKLPDTNITDQLRLIIMGVKGTSDKSLVAQFIDMLPAWASREIRTAYEKVMPNVDLSQDFDCPECGHEGRINVPLTAAFFWPDT